MSSKDKTIEKLINFGQTIENIRAMLLTSSRANVNAKVDFLSDYDVEVYVKNIKVVVDNDDWVKSLGRIVTRWPLQPKSTFNKNWITRLFLFSDGTRIDFQITGKMKERLENIDYGFTVLVDKDNILYNLPKPSNSRFNIKKPSKEEYETLVNDFWWHATYVPKYLYRDELPYAKSMMGQAVQDEFLRKIIEWHIGLKNDWAVSTGTCGRYFKKFLEKGIWKQYASTYSGVHLKDNWDSFYMAVDLFCNLAKNIGKQLGYEYPKQIESDMRTFYKKIEKKSKKR